MNEIDRICLVRRAQKGDAWAFDALVRRFQNRTVAYARCILHDRESAEDAAQEAFLQAWRDLPSLREPAAFAAWLRLIVFKHCDRIRRQDRAPIVPLDLAIYASTSSDPAALAESADDSARVRAVFDGLPERERESALAGEPQSPSDAVHWRAKAMGHDLSLRQTEGDSAGYESLMREREALLASAEGGWVAGERHDLAFALARDGKSEAALALLEQNLAAGQHMNSWAYVMHAAVLWKTTRDRARTLSLLREAPARENRDMTYFFVTLAQFEDVREDPEFLAAVQRPG